MKLIIENIGSLGLIAVDLGNLTVIAGENDVGKSTVGRVVFALIRAFSSYLVEQKDLLDNKIRLGVEGVLFDLRKQVDLANYPKLRSLFSHEWLWRTSNLAGQIDALKQELETLNLPDNDNEALLAVQRSRERLAALHAEMHDVALASTAIQSSIFRALRSEFIGEIVNKSQTGNAKLILVDGKTTVLEIVFNDQGVTSFKGGEALGFKDATLVEGPAILQFKNALQQMIGFSDLGMPRSPEGLIAFHLTDLAAKLQRKPMSDGKPQLSVSIDSLFEGKMVYDHERQEFFLERGGYKLSSDNVATGIKAISILDLLVKGDYVRSDTLLILDEPETSLHPKWQIAYAKILCELASRGAKILVTTHSPYMLEALKGYSARIADAKFYLAQKDEKQVIRFTDTSADISPIIAALSRPLADLIEEIGDEF